ncbi:hypothetical protein BBP40_009566 [Aspergillus hancockii]|nr:hypothetical protein BBP40_009566 [Aspergillus hancockii]
MPTEKEIDNLITLLEQRSRNRPSPASSKFTICQGRDTVNNYSETCEDDIERDNSVSSFVKRLFVISAFDRDTLKRFMSEYLTYVKSHLPSSPTEMATFLGDFAYTLTERRSRIRWNKFVVVGSYSELVCRLSEAIGSPEGPPPWRARRIVFVFSGQGAQYARMGIQLLIYPVFRKALEDATVYMKLGSPWVLLDELLQVENIS